jgi:gliding motility-associated lipoprotein GldD
LVLVTLGTLLFSCGDDPIPKPQGELRLDYPQANYKSLSEQCPYVFDTNTEAEVKLKDDCSMVIEYPQMNASIFITYKKVHKDLDVLLNDAQKLTYEHVAKADNITEQPFVNPREGVYGMFYTISGNAASNSQFYLTDSTSHFVTGSLYFKAKPNYDSILPAAVYLENDIRKIMESFSWKEAN